MGDTPSADKPLTDRLLRSWTRCRRRAWLDRHGDQSKVKQGIVSDITHYGAGYSIDAEAKRIRGCEDWGHVMTANDLYEREIDGVVLRDLIWNWIDGDGKTSHIDH